MGYVVFWIIFALIAAVAVLLLAGWAGRDGAARADGLWSGMATSLRTAIRPAALAVRVALLTVLIKCGLTKDTGLREQLRENHRLAQRDRRHDKMASDLAMLDDDQGDSNISLDDFLTATQTEEPAYYDSPVGDRLNSMYERYSARK